MMVSATFSPTLDGDGSIDLAGELAKLGRKVDAVAAQVGHLSNCARAVDELRMFEKLLLRALRDPEVQAGLGTMLELFHTLARQRGTNGESHPPLIEE
jgi:hypothetical protein